MRITALVTFAIIASLFVDSARADGCCQLKPNNNSSECEMSVNFDNNKCTNTEDSFKETICSTYEEDRGKCVVISNEHKGFLQAILELGLKKSQEGSQPPNVPYVSGQNGWI
jgi:hypothetical protein